jgi:uncharacterized protein (DUF362 family)
MNKKHLVLIRSIKEIPVADAIRDMMERMGWRDIINPDSCIFIKLNLSSIEDHSLKASNTDQQIIECLCELLKSRTSRITLVESDGMRYTAEQAFEKNGTYQLAEKLGVRVLNLSTEKQLYARNPLLEEFGLPEIFFVKTSVLITLPVLKTHALTAFSGALKNQWGCVPRYDRILLHKNLDELIPIVNALLKPAFGIMDGIWGMEGRGPTSGTPRYAGVLLASRHLASLDATAMRLIGLDPYESAHVVRAADQGLGAISETEIDIDGNFENHKTRFEPATLDWAVKLMNALSRYKFFVYRILLNRSIFKVSKKAVNVFRSLGIVK